MSSADPEPPHPGKGKTTEKSKSAKGEVHFGLTSRHSSEKLSDLTDPSSVVDLRGEIASMDAQGSSKNSAVGKSSKLAPQSPTSQRPLTPLTGPTQRRRKYTSAITPSSLSFDMDPNLMANQNSLDIWIKSAPFFAKIPTDEQIQKLFSVPKPPDHQHMKITDKWDHLLQKNVDLTRSMTSCTLEDLPNRKAFNESISEYWKKETPKFHMERSLRKNKTQLHTLLSALVKEDPIDESTIQYTPERKEMSLLPESCGVGYSSLPFEERLKIELESCGMGDIEENKNEEDEQPFLNDMSVLEMHINSMRPIVEEFHNEVNAMLPHMREMDDIRSKKMAEYQRLMLLRKKPSQGPPPQKKP